jgi:putative transposase
MHDRIPPKLLSRIWSKRLKGRSSRLLQLNFHALKSDTGAIILGDGYGVWTSGNITDEMVQEYLEHHRNPSNKDNNPFILE